MGWHCERSKLKDKADLKTYVLTHHDIPPLKIKNNHLDLSFHANPIKALEQFSVDELKNISSIDLGLAYLKPKEVDFLLAKLSNLKEVFLSGQEPWCSELQLAAAKNKVNIFKNSSDYIDDEPLDQNSWEIKRHSKKFYERAKTFFPNKNIIELKLKMQSDPDRYDISEKLLKPQMLESISDLEKLAKNGDDVAVYTLANGLEQGITYTYYSENGYAYKETHKDLLESIKYWKLLSEKGYVVSGEIKRVESNMSNFEMMVYQQTK